MPGGVEIPPSRPQASSPLGKTSSCCAGGTTRKTCAQGLLVTNLWHFQTQFFSVASCAAQSSACREREIAMSHHTSIPFHSVLTFTFLAGFALPAAAATDVRLSESYGKLPLHFEANRGQTHKDVRFLSRGPGYSLYLTSGEAVLVLTRPNPDERKRDARSRHERRAQTPVKSVALRMSLVGAAPEPVVSGIEEQAGT